MMLGMDALLRPPIGFAHRGARAHAPENTLEAFRLAHKLGASGLESDVWLTADGEAVLDHDGVVRKGLRTRPIAEICRADLPDHIPTLAELYDDQRWPFELSLDVKDPDAAPVVVAVVQAAGGDDALGRLWLCHHDWEQVAAWRELSDSVRLVDSTRLKRMKQGPERRAADLARLGVDAVNLHYTDWSLGLTTLFHRFDRYCFAWDAQHERVLAELLVSACDGVFSDHVDRMMAVIAEFTR